jgi:hypothetical protein
MAAEENVIKKADLAYAREIDFVNRFENDLRKFYEVLGVVRPIRKQAGTVLKAYVATGTLENGTVAEGDIIPLSKFEVEAVSFQEITPQKYRKSITIEGILGSGYAESVAKTDAKALSLVQSGIKNAFYNFLATGTGSASGTGLQATLANVRAQLEIKFEDTSIDPVYFVNPLDVATYLGSATISLQRAFGMNYVEDFLGLGTLIECSSVPQGKVYATAKENINLYYIDVNEENGVGEVFDFTTDETGLIGIHHSANYERDTAVTELLCGVTLFAERLDGVIVGTIGNF